MLENSKIEFVMLIGSSFHRYGASADRIEEALNMICEKIGIEANFFSLPTSIYGSFLLADGSRVTRMERLDPGKINLSKLCSVDSVIENVLAGSCSLEEGVESTKKIIADSTEYNKLFSSMSHALIAAAVCVVFKGNPMDAVISLILGLAVGFLTESVRKERLDSIIDGVIAFGINFLSFSALIFLPDINPSVISLAALIVLVPGLMFTTAIRELTSQNLTAGTARMFGSIIIMTKLAVGAYFGRILAVKLFDITVPSSSLSEPQFLVLCLGIIFSSLGLTITFQAKLKYYGLILFACAFSYANSSFFIGALGSSAGIFVAGALLAALANTFSRVFRIPSLMFLLPSTILLVPGALGHKGISLLLEHNVNLGISTIFEALQLGVVLVSGIVFGTAVVHPKKFI